MPKHLGGILPGDRIVSGPMIRSLHVPPIGRTKFHELVKEGKVVRAPSGKGRYLLYATCRNLGLDVPDFSAFPYCKSKGDLVRWAFSLIDSRIFPAPAWAWDDVAPECKDWAALYAEYLRPTVGRMSAPEMKLAFLAGILDALDQGFSLQSEQALQLKLQNGAVDLTEELEQFLPANLR